MATGCEVTDGIGISAFVDRRLVLTNGTHVA
jgi:hypothetical protein